MFNFTILQTGGSEFIEELEEDEFFEDVLEEGLQEEEWLKHGVHYQDGVSDGDQWSYPMMLAVVR